MERSTATMEKILDILKCAESVVSGDVLEYDDEGLNFCLEPTPIAPGGVTRVVPQIPFSCLSASTEGLDNLFSFESSLSSFGSHQIYSSLIKKPTVSHDALSFTTLSMDMAPCSSSECTTLVKRPRKFQTGQWKDRFEELLAFREDHGHLCVPHSYPPNQHLAQWVKRQRYQHKLKAMGCHSTLSDEREDILTSIGFIWDSHRAAWLERFGTLETFKLSHGHCNVPSNYHDTSLAVWCKHQRRQYKRYRKGLNSTLTEERFSSLDSLGFDWNPRNLKC